MIIDLRRLPRKELPTANGARTLPQPWHDVLHAKAAANFLPSHYFQIGKPHIP